MRLLFGSLSRVERVLYSDAAILGSEQSLVVWEYAEHRPSEERFEFLVVVALTSHVWHSGTLFVPYSSVHEKVLL